MFCCLVVWWKVMASQRFPSRRVALFAAVALTWVPLTIAAAPAASGAPPSDDRGYIDSTARCAAPATMVVFGSTAGSRVAICRDSDGDYEYRGVRVRDGARLIVSATGSSDGSFTADNDGIEYRVTSAALVISAGQRVLREEPMLDFHRGASSNTSSPAPASPTPSTPSPTPTTSPTPLPPPLPAEVGGEASEGG